MNEKTIEGINGELDLFSVPVSQKSVLSGDWIQYKPTQQINADSPLLFEISGSGDRYIDTSKTLLNVKLKVLKEDNTPIKDTEAFAVTNNLLSSLFNECTVEYNNQLVSQSHQLYHIKAYWENLFNFSDSAKSTFLTAAGFYQDEAGKFESATAKANLKRASFLRDGKSYEIMGRLHADVLQASQYLLNEVDVRICLRRNADALICLADGDKMNVKVIIEDATLFVRKLNLSPAVLVAHAKILESKTALYHYRRTEMLHFTLGTGTFQKSFENILCGKTPIRMVMGLIENSAFNGNYKQSVLNFQHFNLNYLNLAINGQTVNTKPMQPNYKNGQYMIPYLMSFWGVGIQMQDDGNCISFDDFPNGYCIYSWDLTPDMSASDSHWSMPQNGGIRLECGFSEALSSTVSMIIMAEYRETLELDRSRQCSLTYKG
jgi:hypothetical protein